MKKREQKKKKRMMEEGGVTCIYFVGNGRGWVDISLSLLHTYISYYYPKVIYEVGVGGVVVRQGEGV